MLGDRLKLARNRVGLSLRDLAQLLSNDISPQTISEYESGGIYPSSGVLVALAKALGVSLDFLMSEQDVPAGADWASFFSSRNDISDDFLSERNDFPSQSRKPL